ncbi:MAG: mechanosensitive ion channel family protein [Alistipes sp.]|nr:mechanosensitive ion channel family protein [Alistipes sp.]
MFHLLQTEGTTPLLLPDSVQKEHLRKAIEKLVNLDLSVVIPSLLEDLIWIGVKLFIALIFYAVGRWLIRRVVKLLDLTFERRNVEPSLRSFVRTTVSVLLVFVLIMIVVQTLGVNVTSLIAIFSAATLAIGMALSGTAQNFAGGVMILVVKPYRVGDYITAQGQTGTVREIKLFSTVINTPDNRTIYIPNNAIATAIIDNYTSAETRRVDWSIAISYGDDVDVARKAILAMFEADSRILKDPEAVVRVSSLGDSAVVISARAWVQTADYWNVYYEYNERIYKELPEAGIRFPFPQMDIHIKNEQ